MHSFYLTDELGFVETNYIKESNGGLRGKKLFNLCEILNKNKKEIENMSSKEIAEQLKGKKWKQFEEY